MVESSLSARYSVDLAWQEAQGRSLEAILESRLCDSCRAGGSRPKSRKASADVTKWGRDELLAQIRRCCSRKDDFLGPRTPVLEAAFRLLLTQGTSLTLDEMARELALRRGHFRTSEDSLKRLLERLLAQDSFYGFRLEGSEKVSR